MPGVGQSGQQSVGRERMGVVKSKEAEQVNRRAESGELVKLDHRMESGDVGQPMQQLGCREKDGSRQVGKA